MSVGFASVALGAAAPAVHADEGSVRIREIFNDNVAATHSDFVELQMAAAGQQPAAGSGIRVYGGNGTVGPGYAFAPGIPVLGDNQRLLLGWFDNPNVDITFNTFNLPAVAAGAACYSSALGTVNETPIDCVAWGGATFTGEPAVPTAGAPAVALNANNSLNRSITPNCPTRLEVGDDSNNSAADFSLAPPGPQNSASPPTEASCDPPVSPVTVVTTQGRRTCKVKFKGPVPKSVRKKAKKRCRRINRG